MVIQRTSYMIQWLVAISLVSLSGCGETIEWREEATTEFGTVTVSRKVELNFTGGELSQAATRWPTKYQLSLVHPKTHQRVSWKGEYGFNPAYVGFDPENTYLVIYPMRCDAKISAFSVPGLPYIYLKSSDGRSWQRVHPRDLPMGPVSANLSGNYDGFSIGEELAQKTVAAINGNLELSTDKFFQIKIPSTYEEWSYKHKKPGGYAGCRA